MVEIMSISKDKNSAKTEKATLSITGMHCNSCAMLIEGSLKDAAGVSSASVDFKAARAVVGYDSSKTNSANLTNLVRGMGYGASVQ
jgi:copper chaperone CopZ